MKKALTFLAITVVSTLLADPYGNSSCPGGNCPYRNQGDNYQRPGYTNYQGDNYQRQGYTNYNDGSQRYYQGQPTRDYQRNNQSQGNYGYDQNRDNQGYYNNRDNQGYYDNRSQSRDNQGYYDNRSNSNYGRENYDQDRNSNYDNRRNDNRNLSGDDKINQDLHDLVGAGWMSKGYPNVNFDVSNGNVTLRGTIESADDREKLEKNVKKIDGVKNVDNQIKVTGPQTSYNQRESATQIRNEETKYPQDRAASDSDRILNAKIRDKLSGWFTNDYEGLNFDTSNGVVTVTGVVKTNDDIEKINKKIKDVDGVKSVNNQVTVRRS